MNFARNQRESKLENDLPFMSSTKKKEKRFKKLRSRYQKTKGELSNKKKKVKARLTQLTTFPPNQGASGDENGEMPGQIGLNEDEVMLDEIDPFSIVDGDSVSV